MSSQEEEGFSWGSFFSGPLPGKLAALIGLIIVSRVGVYVRIPGVDVDAFSGAMQSNGLLGYVDALSGGSISKVRAVTLFGFIESSQRAVLMKYAQSMTTCHLTLLRIWGLTMAENSRNGSSAGVCWTFKLLSALRRGPKGCQLFHGA